MVAVSGGADSVALLHLLAELRGPLGFTIAVAHLNHSLRGADSDEDAAFVGRLARSLGVEAVLESADVRALASSEKRSLEDAGHQARRRFLMRVAAQRGCDAIATGHHADDQAETVLIRLIRGAGVRGLAGIEPVSSDRLIRPLIECKRLELRRYLDDRGIPFREDSSNLDVTFLRNRVRHELIPALERDFNPSMVRLLCRAAASMTEVERLLSALADKALAETLVESSDDMILLDSQGLRPYDKVTWRYVFQRVYRDLAGDLHALSHAHLQALVDLVEKRPAGTVIHLPRGIEARRGYGAVRIYRRTPRPEAERRDPVHPEPLHVEREVRLPGLTSLPDLGGVIVTELMNRAELAPDLRNADPAVEFFDMNGISPPLTVRARRAGDRIRPFGFRGTKKLKNLMIDLKIPHETRDRIPVLTDALGLLWVAGIRRSDRAKITPDTERVLSVRWRSERGSERGSNRHGE